LAAVCTSGRKACLVKPTRSGGRSQCEGAILLTTTVALLLCAACSALGIAEFRRTGMLLTPWTLFLALSILDVFLPAAILNAVGMGVQPPWITGTVVEVLPRAMVFFAFGVMLFGIGYYLIDELQAGDAASSQSGAVLHPRLRLALVIFVVAAASHALNIVGAIRAAGSLTDWARDELTNRFRSDAAQTAFLAHLTESVWLPLVFASCGVLFSNRSRHKVLFAWVVPGISLLLCALTFLRGTVLVFFIGLAYIAGMVSSGDRNSPSIQEASLRRRSNKVVVVGVMIFITATLVRNELTTWAWEEIGGEHQSIEQQLLHLAKGETIVGVASIMEEYGDHAPFLNGKTLVDMLLLPVPRAVYTSKPSWYGIDDITRSMGWPPSTQSAVGMPGELYANFGYLGILGMVVYGALFGLARRAQAKPRLGFIYAFIFLPGMFPTFWMGFTGFVSQLTFVPIFLLALLLILPDATEVLARQYFPIGLRKPPALVPPAH
jgi:hypothetical protein